jgi:hypothetical protein
MSNSVIVDGVMSLHDTNEVTEIKLASNQAALVMSADGSLELYISKGDGTKPVDEHDIIIGGLGIMLTNSSFRQQVVDFALNEMENDSKEDGETIESA